MSGLVTGRIRKLGSNDLPTQKAGFAGLNISKLGSNSRLDLQEPVKAMPSELPSEETLEAERQEQIGAQQQMQRPVGGVSGS